MDQLRVAVLDDNPADSGHLVEYLERFKREHGLSATVTVYSAGLDLLEEYSTGYDVIFLDIEMPGMTGLEVARQIRKTDEAVGIVFVTNMAKYAIAGYEVNAIDFMVKPVQYVNFSRKLERAIHFVKKRSQQMLALSDEDGIFRVAISDIRYIEKNGNFVCYYTDNRVFTQRNTIRAVEEMLAPLSFSECTSGCLVNLRHVEMIGKDTVLVGTKELPLSRRMKKKFTQDYLDFIGGAF